MRVLMLPLTLILAWMPLSTAFSATPKTFVGGDFKNEIAFDEPVSRAAGGSIHSFSTMVSESEEENYNERQVVGVNGSGELPGLTHFKNLPEEGYLNLASVEEALRLDDPDAFVDVILMETGDVDGDGLDLSLIHI